jgi:hypothetical protein
MVRIVILKDITPKGWTSTFYVGTSRFEYDARNPTKRKNHQLIFQRGRNYGAVGDMCAGFSHDELLELERQGFVRIERGAGQRSTDSEERETLIYWLLRAYQSGLREGWEEGPSTDETVDGILSVLANRGYDPNLSDAAKALLKKPPKF